MSDIVDRLRVIEPGMLKSEARRLMSEAADEIVRLRAEVERLENDNAEFRDYAGQKSEQVAELQIMLRADRKRGESEGQ